MTALILTLDQVEEGHGPIVGGKAVSLAAMHKNGIRVPPAVCITVEAYRQYVAVTGLADQIILDLYRKPFEEMRWEEIWDTALRIRNAFLKTPVPAELQTALLGEFESRFSTRPVSVRSSAPGEDSSKTSFAGLHESFVNIRGADAILAHVRLVWASLWSDRALLYRQEIGLDVRKSAMGVLVQEMIPGERSGIIFGRSPTDPHVSVIEAVYGLNAGLVDGTIEPDRWNLDRKTGRILAHVPVRREKALRPAGNGVRIGPLPASLQKEPPLVATELSEVYALCMRSEAVFQAPQDMEWTYRGKELHALQSRPITTALQAEPDDQRPWYLSLHQSFENLKALRTRIEGELIPMMEKEARELAGMELGALSNKDLADEIHRRRRIHLHWLDIYKRDCIPFAHGMRLFGQVYNDRMQPEDPFEFLKLLSGTGMVSTERNRMLGELADMIRHDRRLSACLETEPVEHCDEGFSEKFDALISQFGDVAWGENRFSQDAKDLVALLLEMGKRSSEPKAQEGKRAESLEEDFLSMFEEDQRSMALEILDIGRASYRLRDDDNIYLGKIEGQLLAAVEEGRSRLAKQPEAGAQGLARDQVPDALRGKRTIESLNKPSLEAAREKSFSVAARQIVGQPAGPGIATGKARVVLSRSDLFSFKRGEILVCDAIDPGMTFVIPLASAVVERRGGMLIHGAIIAREYGLPCVTGVPDATRWIRTGDVLTVDGYLGMVIIGGEGR
ncbi:PEP/pyruvate-binding domain-containing protein [Desulfatiglans anilini]|uniref:PEP/pyruvate-binding domain-containing protein n=1 Tax=Desulfatiglans anilini TaxID=90728 RepID=UPI00042324B7|nr:PEP/pyruvate-binding domain-containing protein [Desulfatiglans anilini]